MRSQTLIKHSMRKRKPFTSLLRKLCGIILPAGSGRNNCNIYKERSMAITPISNREGFILESSALPFRSHVCVHVLCICLLRCVGMCVWRTCARRVRVHGTCEARVCLGEDPLQITMYLCILPSTTNDFQSFQIAASLTSVLCFSLSFFSLLASSLPDACSHPAWPLRGVINLFQLHLTSGISQIFLLSSFVSVNLSSSGNLRLKILAFLLVKLAFFL